MMWYLKMYIGAQIVFHVGMVFLWVLSGFASWLIQEGK